MSGAPTFTAEDRAALRALWEKGQAAPRGKYDSAPYDAQLALREALYRACPTLLDDLDRAERLEEAYKAQIKDGAEEIERLRNAPPPPLGIEHLHVGRENLHRALSDERAASAAKDARIAELETALRKIAKACPIYEGASGLAPAEFLLITIGAVTRDALHTATGAKP